MGLSAIMNSVFGRGGRKKPVIKFTSNAYDPFVQSLTCKGTITIESIKDGNPVVETYSNLTDTLVNIQADADTEITITGNVIKLDFAVYNDDPDVDDYEGCFDISTVEVSECGRLKSLAVPYCENITELNLAANTALQYLYCGNTSITELNLAANTALQTLYCNGCTSITKLNLAANTALQTLDCGNTSITELNLAANTALQYLYCNWCTSITKLNLAANTALQTLYCGNTSITKLNLAANTALQTLYCNGCTSITELNLAANTALQYLDCGNTSITELNLAANTALQTLDCNGCTSVSNISYPATNGNVSTAIAGAITNATASDGTVYTDSAAAHYSTIADAATAKGWTISQLQ